MRPPTYRTGDKDHYYRLNQCREYLKFVHDKLRPGDSFDRLPEDQLECLCDTVAVWMESSKEERFIARWKVGVDLMYSKWHGIIFEVPKTTKFR